MKLPPLPSPGDRISANTISMIIRAIRSLTPIQGPNVRIVRGPYGTVYSAEARASAKPQAAKRHWIAQIKYDEDSGEYEGEWKNCRFQYGYDPTMGDSDIEDRDVVEDGRYYLEVNMAEDKFTLKHVGLDEQVPGHKLEENIINMPVGEIRDHVQTVFIDMIPIIYKYV